MTITRAIARTAAGLVALVIALTAWMIYVVEGRPTLTPYADYVWRPAERPTAGLRVTFFGVGTLLFDDGETAILTDGFLTRPGGPRFYLSLLLPTFSPDRDLIARVLQRAGVRRLAAVIPTHSHYDHVMDAPEIARLTNAVLVGSESTANVGRGWGLPEDRIRVARAREPMDFGRFRVTMVPSRHSPSPFTSLEGTITAPLSPPARASDYKEGGTFSLVIEHDRRTVIVHPSPNYVKDALRGYRADVVFFSLTGSRALPAYWTEVVRATGARRVVPIHWDDYRRPLDEPLVPIIPFVPWRRAQFAGFDRSMKVFLETARTDGVDVKFLDAWTTVDPFAGL